MKKFFKILLASFAGTFLALFLITVISFSLLNGIINSFSKETTPVVPSSAFLRLNFSETIGERTLEDPLGSLDPMTLTFSKSVGIRTIVEAIDKAAQDDAIKFIYMNPGNISADLTYMEEIRDALLRFRDSGKAIISWATGYDQASYYIASVADKIFVEPSSTNFFFGVSGNMLFFKDLLDNLGIEMQLIRHGRYKAAAEQFVNKTISPENLEQNQRMVDSMWGTIVDGICSSRDINSDRFNYLVDNLDLLLPESLIENNMIDGVKHKDEMEEYLCDIFGVERAKDLKSISASNYYKARNKPNFKIKDKIAILYADGEIVDGNGSDQIAGNRFAEHVSRIRQDSTIKALVLRVNSPGGSAQASAIIERELQLLKQEKPLIVSMGAYAASGGYWISANADRIYTNRSTLTGSIGVFSLVPNVGAGMKKHLSVNNVSIKSNKHSDVLSMMRSLTPTETGLMQLLVDNTYTDFLDIVSNGREMSVAEVDKIGEGRVWTGIDACGIGLADTIGGLYDAISGAAAMAELSEYRVVEYPAPQSTMTKLLEEINKASSTINTLSSPQEKIGSIYKDIVNQGAIKVYARLPYIYTFSY